ncbi:MAG TPA: DNA-processing protein DprA [Beijerinckiaceae bacterium]|nr:DNA-processing protein DprA [Beijerinckiaceae bacterium]
MNGWPAPAPTGIRLSDQQRLDWLRLSRSEGVGPMTFTALINRFGGAGAAVEALPELLRAKGRSPAGIADLASVEREIEAATRLGARFIARGEADYPALLREIADAPPLVAVLGRIELLHLPLVAMVGSRNASGVGRSFAERMAHDLTRHGYGVVSGLARGIDTRVHVAALAFGTVAVLAGGLDRPYPPENLDLMRRIGESGAVISEMPFGWEPRGRDFPRRNRIISGLCMATVVVEAARKSGSLITARFALEQGREVFAVPGSPLDPRAEGSNDLIKASKAHFCTSVEDIIAELQPMLRAPDLFGEPARATSAATYQGAPLWDELFGDEQEGTTPGLFGEAEAIPADFEPPGDLAARILALLGPSPLAIDDLLRLAEAPAPAVHAILTDLDLAGRLERHGGNRVSLVVSACRD